MHYSVPSLFALGALSSFAGAVNILSFQQPDHQGHAVYFHGVGADVCCLTITGHANTTKDAIANHMTTVLSGEMQIGYNRGGRKFNGWVEGPGSNSDGPLQCGTIGQDSSIDAGTHGDTYLNGTYHGLSWQDRSSKARRAAQPVTVNKLPDGVLLHSQLYMFGNAPPADVDTMLKIANTNQQNIPAHLNKYISTNPN